MVFDILGLGKKRKDPNYWKEQLNKAWADLDTNKIEQAGLRFQEITSELDKIKGTPQLSPVRLEIRIGQWAIRYKQGNASASELMIEFNTVQPDVRSLMRASRVLGRNWDRSIDALLIYRKLIEIKPGEKNARAVMSILDKTSVSIEAFDLLRDVVLILKDDIDAKIKLFRWAILFDKFELASTYADEVIKVQPDNEEAHRCLGIIYEKQGEWKAACNHYKESQDWYRLAIVSNKNGEYAQALNALNAIPENRRKSLGWLYHAGWAYYRLGHFEKALKFWGYLTRIHPDQEDRLNSQIRHIEIDSMINVMSSIDNLKNNKLSDGPEPYLSEARFRKGLVELFLNRNLSNAETYLTFEPNNSHKPEKAPLMLEITETITQLKSDESLGDIRVEEKPSDGRDYQDWLSGLWFAPIDPEKSLTLLDKSLQALDSEQEFCSSEKIATYWLVEKITQRKDVRNTIDTKILRLFDSYPTNPVLEQITTPYLSTQIVQPDPPNFPWIKEWLPRESSEEADFLKIRFVYFTRHNRWKDALELTSNLDDNDLIGILLRHCAQTTLNQKTEYKFIDILGFAAAKFPEDSEIKRWITTLGEPMLNHYWNQKDWSSLDRFLQLTLAIYPGNPEVHHRLALVNSRLALQYILNGKSEVDFDPWKNAIGHWSVALTDARYWRSRYKGRSGLYGVKVEKTSLDELRRVRIPALLKKQFRKMSRRQDPDQDPVYHLYASLVEQDFENTLSVRHLIRSAKKAQYSLPVDVLTLISPVLIMQKGSYIENTDFLIDMDDLNISKKMKNSLEIAFSPLMEANSLLRCKYYQDSQDMLQSIEINGNITDSETELLAMERKQAFIDQTEFLISGHSWEKALDVSRKAHSRYPKNSKIKSLYKKAVIGWGNNALNEGAFDSVIEICQQAKTDLGGSTRAINQVNSQALVQKAHQKVSQGDIVNAEKLYRKALKVDTENPDAVQGISGILFQKVVDYEKQNNFSMMFSTARQLYDLTKDPPGANIYASAAVTYAGSLMQSNKFQDAINILEPILSIPYDPSVIQVPQALSMIFNDYGALVYNNGSRSQGLQLMRQALEVDPSNQVARNNISISGGYLY